MIEVSKISSILAQKFIKEIIKNSPIYSLNVDHHYTIR